MLCSVFSAGLMGLGLLAAPAVPAATSPPATAVSGGGQWIPAGEISRSQSLTQPLAGGRWLYQYGSGFDTELSRSGNTALVQGNASGGLWEFTFDENGSYRLVWSYSLSLGGQRSRSSAEEQGTWALDQTTLTLSPQSQRAHYENSNGTQDKQDEDLSERSYQVVDIQLESVESAGVPLKRWPGIELSGPGPKWGLDATISVDLQRL
jgi:hypothetical protein